MRKRSGTLLFLALLFGGGWYGYNKIWAAPPPPQYRTSEVDRGKIVATVTATGTIQPLVTVLVGSQVSGTILRWNADFNQQVKKGDVLAEIDPDRFRRELDMRTAAVAVARANLEQARVRLADGTRERKRIEGLFQKGTASENELLIVQAAEAERQAAVQAGEAQVQVAEAERQASQVDLDRTIISSPIDGVVISRDIDAGQTVAASLQAPTLFTIAADLRAMQVHANLSETDVGQIRAGMQAEFTVDAYPGRKFRGTVSQVRFNPTIVDNVVSYITIIDVDNEDLALRPGMTATVAFEVARVDDVLTVPNAALRFKPPEGSIKAETGERAEKAERPAEARERSAGGGKGRKRDGASGTVHVLDGKTLRPVNVQLGITDSRSTEVTGGDLKPGDRVVTGEIAAAGNGKPSRFMKVDFPEPEGPMMAT
ncbi:MAG: efflux RND transporter periplasmic adaptor subunit, partial [Phycisphaerae bacterium]|nr:efflux RND transporter periplasmic adaptor subunit [Phycisphaerae bacterium]